MTLGVSFQEPSKELQCLWVTSEWRQLTCSLQQYCAAGNRSLIAKPVSVPWKMTSRDSSSSPHSSLYSEMSAPELSGLWKAEIPNVNFIGKKILRYLWLPKQIKRMTYPRYFKYIQKKGMKEILNFLSALTSGKISTTWNAIRKCQQRLTCKNHLEVNFCSEEVPPNLHLGAGKVKETESEENTRLTYLPTH